MFTTRRPQNKTEVVEVTDTMVTNALDMFRYAWTGIDFSPRVKPSNRDVWGKADPNILTKSRSVAMLSNVNQYHQQLPEDLVMSYILLSVDVKHEEEEARAMATFRETIAELQKLAEQPGNTNMTVSARDCAAVEQRFQDLITIFSVCAPIVDKSLDIASKLLCVEDLSERKGTIRTDASLRLFTKPDAEDEALMAKLTDLFIELRKRHSPTLYAKGMIALEAQIHSYHLQSVNPKDKRADAYLRLLLFPVLSRDRMEEIFKPVDDAIKSNHGLLVYLFMNLSYPDKNADYYDSWREIEPFIPYGIADYFWGFKNTYTKPSIPFPSFFTKSEKDFIDKFMVARDDAWKCLNTAVDRKTIAHAVTAKREPNVERRPTLPAVANSAESPKQQQTPKAKLSPIEEVKPLPEPSVAEEEQEVQVIDE
jgi:hypothetical protein